MLTVRNLSLSFGPTEVLKNISLDVGRGEVLAVTGANGSGKTALLRCITGELKPSTGSITRQVDYVYLPQQIADKAGTAREFLLSISPQLCEKYREMIASDENSPDYASALSAFTDLGGYQLLAELERRTADFGFDTGVLDRQMASFSEGEKQIFAVIRVLASPARLVFADEPLNHLDISVRMYLEEVIGREKRRGRGFLMVTHDRVFADRVADRTLFIQRGKGLTVHGGYSWMIAHLELEFESKRREAEDISRKIRRLEKELTSRKTWSARREKDKIGAADKGFVSARAARMARRAKAAERRQEKLVSRLKETKPFVEKRVKLSFDTYDVMNRRVVFAKGIHKSFGDNLIFKDVNLDATTKDRVVLIGPNGSGKTTLLRCLLGEEDVDKGEVKLSEHVNYRYLPQNVEAGFKRGILLDNLTAYGVQESRVRQYLGAARLRKDKVLQPVSTLSRGELMRAWIVGAILARADFLFLDEPTNHLDIESLAVLDELIMGFPGGMFAISHDRAFIARHANRVLSIQNKSIVPWNL